MNRKFTDKELIEEHKKGLSDIKIARIFKCSLPTVNKRRYKLGLVANFKNFKGERNTKEECLNNAKKFRKRRIELIKKQYLTPSFKERERLRAHNRRKTKSYQEFQQNYRVKTKLNKLPEEVIVRMLSAIEDVRNGRYIVVIK